MVTICSVDGCQNKSRARGYCGNHYQKWIRYRDPLHVVKYGTKQCSIEECSNKHMAKGFCEQHYGKWKRYGDPLYLVDPEETKVTGIDIVELNPYHDNGATASLAAKIISTMIAMNLSQK